MSQKKERDKRNAMEAQTFEILISMIPEPGGRARIEINHPENLELAVNVMMDALRLMIHRGMQKDEAQPTILTPTKKDISLVN